MQHANHKPVPLKTIREVKPNTFIFERPGALAADFCDEVIRRFEADKHYQRKENLLFPYLEKKGITGPSNVMWAKDDEIRTQ